MKIGLIDVDGHNFPNLPLMKLSAYHKSKGDSVEWYDQNGQLSKRYDIVYMSKVFTEQYSPDIPEPWNAEQVIKGGTGYGTNNKLPDHIEHVYPDYSLYPQYQDMSYGFLTRGCPRNCSFCIVSEKEGRHSRHVADLTEFHRGQKTIKLLDPNLLACRDHEALLEQLSGSGARVDFTQGLDIRLTNLDNTQLLSRMRINRIHFAWDNAKEDLTSYFKTFTKHYCRKSASLKRVYVLVNYDSTHEEDMYRVYTLIALGYEPFIMIYDKGKFVEGNRNKTISELEKEYTLEQIEHFRKCRKLQRWVNGWVFRKEPDFKNYSTKKG